EDQLSGLLYSDSISVDSNGAVASFELSKGEVGVWVYSDENSDISIGNIGPSIGISGNEVSISGTGFGSEVGQVYFENTLSDIVEWSDTLIK
ncbi:IPT/TIG domain-containing protein, partial [Streptococcus suis]